MTYALVVLRQLGIMTVMVALGWIAAKFLKITSEGSRQMSLVLTRIITACVLFSSFLEVEAKQENLTLLLLSWGLCLIAHLIAIIVSRLVFRKGGREENAVARFSMTFTNNGFLGFPLVLVLCGERGIFFASAGVMLSNLLTWTYGVSLFQSKKKNLAVTLLAQPTLWAVTAGLSVFLLRMFLPQAEAPLPAPLTETISIFQTALGYLKEMYTPMAMLIMGINLHHTGLLTCFKNRRSYLVTLLRMVAIPLFFLVILLLLPINDKDLLLTVFLISACPCAMLTSMIALQYGNKERQEEADQTVMLSTLFSPITIPLMILFADLVLSF